MTNCKRRKKLLVGLLLAVTILIGTSLNAFAASNDAWTEAVQTEAAKNGVFEKWSKKWDNLKDDWTQISLTPGANPTELNFAWYSKGTDSNPKIKIGKHSDLSDAKELKVVSTPAVKGYQSNKATVISLEENTTYYYSYTKNGRWSQPMIYKTQNTKNFSFIYVGDPQIGSSSRNTATGNLKKQGQDLGCRNDGFNWNNTLNLALSVAPKASFILSAGDQVQSRDKKTKNPLYTGNEIEYAAFLSADVLKSLPIATAIGNHDSLSKNYSFHFNNPNTSDLGRTNAGGDYYYTYGNTLFIMLNTNNRNIAEHKEFIERAVYENPNTKWRIVTVHHDIYGSGEHSNEPKIVSLRYNLISIFEKNNIDIVLAGHDHTYSRTFLLKGGRIQRDKMLTDDEFDEYFEGDKSVDNRYNAYLSSVADKDAIKDSNKLSEVVNPEGILYITANSASGSKYYELVDNQQAYIAKRWQRNVPTFSVINIAGNCFTIDTYRTDTMKKIDNTFSIVKTDKN